MGNEFTEHKKYKVLIADDEEMIQRLIEVLIPWDELDLELAAKVSNGLEAIAYLKDHTADILITDARMPECDGIQLIRWCSEQGRDMKYIVISGYRHFEYAHGALQYGADSYLLKPINQDELTDKLKTVIQKIEESRQIGEVDQAMQQISQNRERMRNHFISSYMFDGNSIPDRSIPSVEYINEEYQMNFAGGIYRAVFIKIDTPVNSGLKLDKAYERIYEESDNIFREYMTEYIGCEVHSGVLLFTNYQESAEIRLKADLETLYKKVSKIFDIFEGVHVAIGLGIRGRSIGEIRKCIMTAADALKFQLYLPHVSVFDFENYKYKEVPFNVIWTPERRRLLENYMRSGNQKGIRKLLFDLKLEIHQDKEISPVSIYAVVRVIAENAGEIFDSVLEEKNNNYDIVGDFLKELENQKTIDDIISCLEHMVLRSMEIMDSEIKQQEIQPIRMIRDYIDEHYAENISLNDVADQVQLSKNYVSAIFRKETGVNYLDYLTAKRIDEAARLLRKTNLSISEVSEKVGYADVKYFSKMFKKNLGMNPSEYRKMYL